MTAGITSSVCLPSLRRLRLVHDAFLQVWANASDAALFASQPYHRRRPPIATMSMFKRANATYEAKKKTISSSNNNNNRTNTSTAPRPQVPLAKQLFPSSSPTPLHDANIKDQFQKRPGSSHGHSRFSQPSGPVPPPQSRSSNPYTHRPSGPTQSVTRPASGKPFASLYTDNQKSFNPEPDFIDLMDDDAKNAKPGRSVADVDIFDDDFSDDENLDLDYQCPSTLPAPPPQATPAKIDVDLTVDDNTSVVSWSQSSPSHYYPAQSVSQSTDSQTSAKRSAPEDLVPAAQPVAKKRQLPVQYQKQRLNHERPYPTSVAQATPAAKPTSEKGPAPWNLTPGAVNDLKKLKGKSKKSAEAGVEASATEIKQAVTSHTVRQSAISLSKEQEVVKQLVCDNGKSVFFTGPAGTGKSVLMRAIIAQLKKKYAKDPERLAVTASTGLAACNIGGMTLHSFSGIGLGKDDVATLVKKIRRNPKAKNRWLRTKILVIDEISMVDGDLFDKLSQIGRTLRNNGRPWGGIQLVITGDFFQLPPVPDYNSRDIKFAFEAATWNTSIDHTIGLTEVFRQKDPGKSHVIPTCFGSAVNVRVAFAQMLNEIRLGRISDETVRAFKSMSRPLQFPDGLEVTELYVPLPKGECCCAPY